MERTPDRRPDTLPPTRFEYFLLQARFLPVPTESRLQVTVEDLGTGDRWTFGSGSELARFLESRAEP